MGHTMRDLPLEVMTAMHLLEFRVVLWVVGSVDRCFTVEVLNAIETCFLEPQDTAARPSRKMNPD